MGSVFCGEGNDLDPDVETPHIPSFPPSLLRRRSDVSHSCSCCRSPVIVDDNPGAFHLVVDDNLGTFHLEVEKYTSLACVLLPHGERQEARL